MILFETNIGTKLPNFLVSLCMTVFITLSLSCFTPGLMESAGYTKNEYDDTGAGHFFDKPSFWFARGGPRKAWFYNSDKIALVFRHRKQGALLFCYKKFRERFQAVAQSNCPPGESRTPLSRLVNGGQLIWLGGNRFLDFREIFPTMAVQLLPREERYKNFKGKVFISRERLYLKLVEGKKIRYLERKYQGRENSYNFDPEFYRTEFLSEPGYFKPLPLWKPPSKILIVLAGDDEKNIEEYVFMYPLENSSTNMTESVRRIQVRNYRFRVEPKKKQPLMLAFLPLTILGDVLVSPFYILAQIFGPLDGCQGVKCSPLG